MATAYSWDNLAAKDGARLSYGFYETEQGIRYTLSEPAHREVLDRLLALNHQRYAKELAAGLHEKKNGKARKKTLLQRSTGSTQQDLF